MTSPALIQTVGGATTLMWRGQPLPMPIFCLFYDQATHDEVITRFVDHGVRSFAVRNTLSVGDGEETDFSIARLCDRIMNVARLAPQAAIMPDLLMYPSESWLLSNPHECFITADSHILVMGKESQVEGVDRRRDYVLVPGPSIEDAAGRLIGGEKPEALYGRRRVSPFSKLFAQDAARSVARLFAELQRLGVGDRLCGAFLECYNCGEWNLGMRSPDQCEAAVKGFREFLAERYADDRALAQAWEDSAAMRGAVRPPERYAFDDRGGLRTTSAKLDDYMAAEARALTGQFLTVARDVKAVNPGLLVGAFFPGVSRYQSECHELYSDRSIDFIATPLTYEHRGVTGAEVSQSLIPDSLAAFGKVWLDEMDTRLHTSAPSEIAVGRADNPKQSLELLWRDAGLKLVRGHAGWWLDFNATIDQKLDHTGQPPYTWHSTPEILAFHRRFSEIWSAPPTLDRTCVAQVKVFTPSTVGRTIASYQEQAQQRQLEWSFSGLPLVFDSIENLLDGRTEPGRLNIIFAAQHLCKDTLEQLGRRANAQPGWWLWWYGAGIAEMSGSPEETRARSLHGVSQQYIAKPSEPTGVVTAEGESVLGLAEGSEIGKYSSRHSTSLPALAQWRLVVKSGENVRPLATFADDDRQVAVALHETPSGVTHLIFNLPILGSSALRAIGRAAGCHVYLDEDHTMHASRGLIVLHTASAGSVCVTLPTEREVYDLRNKSVVTPSSRAFRLDAEAGSTMLFEWCAPVG